MLKRVASVLAVLAFVVAFSLPRATRAVPPKPAKSPAATKLNVPQDKDDAKEPHPEIRRAIRQLENAKDGLAKYGAHDFGGHRAKAIDHIDQALSELKQALQYDKH